MKRYDSYKDSGIEWIGEIPSHWDCKRLKQLVESPLKYGANEAAESDDPSQPRYIRITDFGQNGVLREDTFKSLPENLAREYLLEEGDILLARSGATVGKTFLFQNYKGKACFAGYLIRCRFSKNRVDSRFINYYTFSNFYENWKQSIFQQATIQNIGADKYNQLLITTPPHSEQTLIANYLDQKTAQIDDLIAKKERLIQLLEEERTAIINQAVTKGLDPTVPMKDSGIEWLGEIPAHWEVMRLRNIVDTVKTGSTPPSDEIQFFEPQEINWYGPGDFENLILGEAKRKISHLAIEENKCRLFPSNSILLIGIGATVGKVGLITEPSSSNQQINAIILKKFYNPSFYLFFLASIKEIIIMEASSATLPIFNQTQTKNIIISVPPIEEQNQIVGFIQNQTERIQTISAKTQQEIELLKEYKTALISEVVTGKVDVRKYV